MNGIDARCFICGKPFHYYGALELVDGEYKPVCTKCKADRKKELIAA